MLKLYDSLDSVSILSRVSAGLKIWLGLGTKSTRLGLEKHYVLAPCEKQKQSWKISTGVTFTNVETQS